MNTWDKLADDQTITQTTAALTANGIVTMVVANSQEAKEKVLELVPSGAEVLTMTSVTLDAISVSEEINKKDGKYSPVRDKLYAMDRATQAQEMSRLGAASAYTVGSVHAVTQDGHVLIASASGSQLPAYAYASGKVIWVVGTQKIVKNTDEGIRRIYEYVFPLENERAKKAYGMESFVSKLLIVNREFVPGRLTLIFVKEKLGF